MILLMAKAGLRIGSVVGLEVEDIDLVHQQLHLRRMKNDRPTLLPIAPDLVRELRVYLRDAPPRGPLFASWHGRRVVARQINIRLAQWSQRAGIPHVAPHQLRHSFATQLLAKTGNLLIVRDALCHASIYATANYVRLEQGALRAAIRAT